MPKPSPVPFPVDRSSLLLIVRSFVGLLAERVAGGDGEDAGCDYPLPGGLSLDGIACSLFAYARDVEALPPGMDEDDDEEKLAEIAETLRAMVEDAPPDEDADDVRRN